mmetsp:Transcript_9346/g.21077  ORF Transcript_9346/g.21077 Transcript_9346/m.21077 type:complete len:236 (-) Transcript_9346:1404-2111(-)
MEDSIKSSIEDASTNVDAPVPPATPVPASNEETGKGKNGAKRKSTFNDFQVTQPPNNVPQKENSLLSNNTSPPQAELDDDVEGETSSAAESTAFENDENCCINSNIIGGNLQNDHNNGTTGDNDAIVPRAFLAREEPYRHNHSARRTFTAYETVLVRLWYTGKRIIMASVLFLLGFIIIVVLLGMRSGEEQPGDTSRGMAMSDIMWEAKDNECEPNILFVQQYGYSGMTAWTSYL